jgi:hypothetical protein
MILRIAVNGLRLFLIHRLESSCKTDGQPNYCGGNATILWPPMTEIDPAFDLVLEVFKIVYFGNSKHLTMNAVSDDIALHHAFGLLQSDVISLLR